MLTGAHRKSPGHTGKLKAGLARALEAVCRQDDPEAGISRGQLTVAGCGVAGCQCKLGAAHKAREHYLGVIQREGREGDP